MFVVSLLAKRNPEQVGPSSRDESVSPVGKGRAHAFGMEAFRDMTDACGEVTNDRRALAP